jgi:hypothetical protein
MDGAECLNRRANRLRASSRSGAPGRMMPGIACCRWFIDDCTSLHLQIPFTGDIPWLGTRESDTLDLDRRYPSSLNWMLGLRR